MKRIILLYGILFHSVNIYSQDQMHTQNLISSIWRIDKIVGIDSNNTQEFIIQPVDTSNRFWMWGNTIKFDKDSIFKCSYSARCGNDCFPSSTGVFSIIDSLKIQLRVIKINQRGHCTHFQKTLNHTLGTYQLEKKDSLRYSLIKL